MNANETDLIEDAQNKLTAVKLILFAFADQFAAEPDNYGMDLAFNMLGSQLDEVCGMLNNL